MDYTTGSYLETKVQRISKDNLDDSFGMIQNSKMVK